MLVCIIFYERKEDNFFQKFLIFILIFLSIQKSN